MILSLRRALKALTQERLGHPPGTSHRTRVSPISCLYALNCSEWISGIEKFSLCIQLHMNGRRMCITVAPHQAQVYAVMQNVPDSCRASRLGLRQQA